MPSSIKLLTPALNALFPDPSNPGALAHNHPSITVTSPLDGGEIAKVPQATAADVASAVVRARRAQGQWAAQSVQERTAVLDKLKALVLEKAAFLLDLITVENGKARSHAHEEVIDVVLNAAYYAKHAAEFLAPEPRQGAVPVLTKVQLEHLPVGVVGVISPWNYPFNLALSDALAALAAGNAVVLKPASQTPLCALAARQLLIEAGLEPDLFQVVIGPGGELGQALIDEVDQVMFTGSTAVGKKVAAAAGARMIPFSCELGGKNPMIVLPGVDAKAAARTAVQACFTNAGQLCLSIERIYVHTDVWDQFVPAFVKATRAITVAANLSWSNAMGPLISQTQLETVAGQVEEAVKIGAKVLVGGKTLPKVAPYAYAPTILTDVPPEATLYGQETFGPVVALYRAESTEAAISAANNTPYGLNASVLGPLPLAERVAAQIESGSVNVNDGYAAVFGSVDAVAGGWKESGMGGRHGREGLLKYTRARALAISKKAPLGPVPGVPEGLRAKIMRTYLKHR